MAMRFGTVLLAVGFLAAGCANWNSIHRHETIGDSAEGAQVLLIDAKQRAILTSKRPSLRNDAKGNYTETYRAFCSEPSPDVFSVLSQAASASGSFGQSADSINAAAQLAISSAETGATISRTQTINMLREMMYRTCERYISGALDDSQFSVQAIRDQHTMVSILAIEQLTGAVTPPPVVLASNASAGAGGSTNDAIVRLDDAWKAKKTADQNLADKKSAFTAVDGDASKSPKKCDELLTKPDGATTDPEKEKLAACTKAKQDVGDATTALNEATGHYTELKAMMGAGPVSTAVTAASPPPASASSVDKSAQVQAVATAVEHIVDQNFSQDEFIFFCIRAIPVNGATPVGDTVGSACLNYIKEKVNKQVESDRVKKAQLQSEALRLEALNKQMSDELSTYVPQTDTYFAAFWAKVSSADNPEAANQSRLKEVVDALLAKNPNTAAKQTLEKLKKATTKSGARAIFGTLSMTRQKALAN